jgi:hypothetical protein
MPIPASIDYRTYLESDAWKRRRSVALSEAGHRCQVCNREGQLDVHHRTYERLGNELPQDLVVLCRECHQLFHSNRTRGTSSGWNRPLSQTLSVVIGVLFGLAAAWAYLNMAQWSTYESEPFNYMSGYIRFWVLATLAAYFFFPSSWPKIVLGSIGLFGAIYFLVIA